MSENNTTRKYTSVASIYPKRQKAKGEVKITAIKNAFTNILTAIKAKHLS
jgi:hypothetical protein